MINIVASLRLAGFGLVAERDADLIWVELELTLATANALPAPPAFHAEDLFHA